MTNVARVETRIRSFAVGFGFCGLLLSVVLTTGCQQAEDPALASERTKYVLSEEPSGAVGVLEVREQAAAGAVPVVMVGRVGAGAETTWDPGKAAFVITDPSVVATGHEHGADGHDHDNCPFCKAEAKAKTDSTALVRVVDAEGNVLPYDARKFLSIQENQLIVVRGSASIDDLGNLVVAADGIYPRR